MGMNEGIKKASTYTNPISTTLRVCLANGIFKMYHGSLQVVDLHSFLLQYPRPSSLDDLMTLFTKACVFLN